MMGKALMAKVMQRFMKISQPVFQIVVSVAE